MHIQALMQSPVITLDADASLGHAQALMQRQGISHLPVLQGKKLVGMVTSHALRHFEQSMLSWASNEPPGAVACRQVREVMTQRFMRLTPDTPAHVAARLVWEGQAESFLVMDKEEILGIVTTTDLLDALILMLAEQAPATYGHLLVPTNFGPLAQQVVNTALTLANRHGAELTILHVLPRLTKLLATDIDHVAAEMLVKIAEDCKTDALERLSTLVVADTIKHATYQVVEGEPAAAIVKTATRVGADLIIMGQYRRRFANFLRCSVTTQVIRQAPCPVLVVKE